jgi:hypothetical protein
MLNDIGGLLATHSSVSPRKYLKLQATIKTVDYTLHCSMKEFKKNCKKI